MVSRRLQARDWVDGECDTMKQEVAEAARARAMPLLYLLAEGRRRACPCGLANSAGPSRWLRWAPGKLAQVSLSLFYLSFSISVICFDLI